MTPTHTREHAKQERRRSNAAGKHRDKRTKRRRTRGAARHAAITNSTDD